LSKLGKDIVKEVKDAIQSSSALESVHKQISKLAAQLKSAMGDSAGAIDKLLQVSDQSKDDIGYLKNKTQQLKAAMDLSQKMVDNIANKPVVQTWFEYK
jgi:seryl-tRNA synthetase